MSRRRRRSGNSPGNQNQNQNQGQGQNQARADESAVVAFWASPEDDFEPASPIRPTSDPAALPRSLGDPPLTPEAAAQQALAVVYEEAVRAATALAAVNGLLTDGELPED